MSVEHWMREMEQRRGGAILPGLERIRTIGETLELLHPSCTVITVAGTNGKGSTVAALESLYLAAGYCVAAYTSPHLLRFNERIRFNGGDISDADMSLSFSAVNAADTGAILSGFELLTLAALWHFKRLQPDVLILEVGLGGRLDATNVIDSDVAVVTTVDYDHQEYLGHTLAEIGAEKVGIARSGKPLVLAQAGLPSEVIERCHAAGCTLIQRDADYFVEESSEELIVTLQDKRLIFARGAQRLHPEALASAIVVSELLQERLPLTPAQREAGLSRAQIAGRVQYLAGDVSVLYDVSHNPQSVSRLVETLEGLSHAGDVHAVFSALGDKDIDSLIAMMLPHVDFWYTGVLNSQRAAGAERLQAAFAANAREVHVYPDIEAAWEAACHRARTGDLIVVYGSFLTVGAVMSDGRLPSAFKEVV